MGTNRWRWEGMGLAIIHLVNDSTYINNGIIIIMGLKSHSHLSLLETVVLKSGIPLSTVKIRTIVCNILERGVS